jgi:arylsulfatase A-like enzyme
MLRPRFPLAVVTAVMVFLVLPLLTGASAGAAEDVRPDVLFIAIDDLNDWVGHLGGHPDVKTPQLDRLARRGTSFTNAHCAAPACNPSRAALLSGLRPSTSGIYHNSHDWVNTLADVVTLPQHFKANGYRVLGGGKIFHGSASAEKYFHEYYRRRELPPPKVPYNGLDRAHFDWKALDLAERDMPDYKLVSWAIEKLNEERDRPLFLAVGIVKPHLPWYAPQKYFDMYPKEKITLPEVPDDDLADVPPIGLRMARPEGDHKAVVDAGQWRDAVQAYLATISFVDDQVGRLIDAVDKTPAADDTVIVLWGDHGWHLGEKHHWRKFTLWEEATRAPLFFVAPGVGKPGALSSRPVDFMGIYPTLSDLCGLPVPEHVEGVSLRPLLEAPDAAWDRMALTTHGRGEHGVRCDRWRYIRYHDGTDELYDHVEDPMEWQNLAGKPQCDARKQEMAQWMPETEVPNAPVAERYKRRRARERKK